MFTRTWLRRKMSLHRINIRSFKTIRLLFCSILIVFFLRLVCFQFLCDFNSSGKINIRHMNKLHWISDEYDSEIRKNREQNINEINMTVNFHDSMITSHNIAITADTDREKSSIKPVTDVFNVDVAKHKEAMEIIGRYPRLGLYTTRLLHVIDVFRNGRKYFKLMSIFDDLVIDLWNFHKGNRTGDDHRMDSWDGDGANSRNHDINCTNIHAIRIVKKLGAGYIKVAYEGNFGGKSVVVKVKHTEYPLDACGLDEFECAVYRDVRFLNELILFDHLEHPSLIRLLGYCVHSGMNTTEYLRAPGVVGVYEMADRLKHRVVAAWNGAERLKYTLQVAEFLDFVEHTAFGRLTVRDIGWNQFVVIRDNLCLADLDLADNMDDPKCAEVQIRYAMSKDGDNVSMCHFSHPYYTGYNFDIPCINGICYEMGQRHNMMKMHWVFLQHFLHWEKFPEHMQEEVASLSRQVYNYIPAAELSNRIKLLLDYATSD